MTVRPSARFHRLRVGRETCQANLPVQHAAELAVLAVPLEGAAAAPLEEAVPVLRLAELIVALGQEVHFCALARRRIFTVWRQSKLAIHGLPTQITTHFSLSRSFVLPHFPRF